MEWSKALAVGAGAVGLIAAVACFLKDEDEAEVSQRTEDVADGAVPNMLAAENASRDYVVMLLNKILAEQKRMKSANREIVKKIRAQAKPNFFQAYELVSAIVPEDPLEKAGFKMEDLDTMLQRHQSDPEVRAGIMQMMGADQISFDKPPASVKDILAAHKLMIKETLELGQTFKKLSLKKRAAFDTKTLMVAVTVMVGAKVEEQTGLSSDDIEAGVAVHQAELQKSSEWNKANKAMQGAMMTLVQAQAS